MALPKYVNRSYKGAAEALTLSASVSSSATTLPVVGTFTTWPTHTVATTTGPFTVTLTLGTDSEEKVLCSKLTRGGSHLVVFVTGTSGRGYDGTVARAHTPTGNIEQVTLTWSAVEAKEANRVAAAVGSVAAASAGYVLSLSTPAKNVEWVNPAVQFGLNTTAANIVAVPGTQSAGSSTTAAKANHVHPLALSVTHTTVLAGTYPATPSFVLQVFAAAVTTTTLGQATITLPVAFTHCLLSAWVQIDHATTNPNYTVATDHVHANLSGFRANFKTANTGTHVGAVTIRVMVWAIGC